jgi:hypothetical protein
MTSSGSVQHASLSEAAIDEALRRAAAAARQQYVRAALSMPVWRGGRLTWLNPSDAARFGADSVRGKDSGFPRR